MKGMPGHTFELVGGDLALDFVNTIHDWTVPDSRDYLAGFNDALQFGEESGVLSRAEARRQAGRPATGELQRLRELRGRLERIFRAVTTDHTPAAADLDDLVRQAAEAGAAARLVGSRGRVVRQIDADAAKQATLRFRVVEAAIALLTSARLERLKSCPSCGWLFLDTSKNRSRRWCDMATCGSIDKARRYYRRTRRRQSAAH
jgi:predicted RNA-binding Zn ribbon-like protein